MKLIKEFRENAAILTLRGEFDSFVCTPFVKEVESIFKEVKFVIIDLRLVLFINSTAIGSLVKLHKGAKKEGGRLVLTRPSNFVNDVLDSLGLKEVFTISDDPEKALKELGASDDGTDISGDSSVIIQPTGGKGKCIGQMSSIDEAGITVKITEQREDLAEGTECKVKFRLPLYMKGHYFEAQAEITESKKIDTGTSLTCSFKSMNDDDQKSIAQYVEEMKFLRSEAKKNNK